MYIHVWDSSSVEWEMGGSGWKELDDGHCIEPDSMDSGCDEQFDVENLIAHKIRSRGRIESIIIE